VLHHNAARRAPLRKDWDQIVNVTNRLAELAKVLDVTD
jgi:hypothetical protein